LKNWSTAARDALVSGTAASLASTLVLSLCAEREKGMPLAPTNATSRWIWGDRAAHQRGPSLRYTAVGYAIHHVSASFWALVYERVFAPRGRHAQTWPTVAAGMSVAAMACFGDYKLTPCRFQPGFEKHLSKTSLALSYGAFGLALAAHSLLSCARRTPSS
jgi:hypothetical protein